MHALAWLSAHWSVRAEALITCRRVDPPRAAAAILAARTSPSRTLRRLLDLPPPPPPSRSSSSRRRQAQGRVRAPRPRRRSRRGREDASPPGDPPLLFPSPSSFPPSRIIAASFAPPSYPDGERFSWYSRRAADVRAHTSADVIAARRAIRRERPRHPLAVVRATPRGTTRGAVLRVPSVLLRVVVRGRVLVLLAVHPRHARGVREPHRAEPTTNGSRHATPRAHESDPRRAAGREMGELDPAALVPGDVVRVSVGGKKGGGVSTRARTSTSATRTPSYRAICCWWRGRRR